MNTSMDALLAIQTRRKSKKNTEGNYPSPTRNLWLSLPYQNSASWISVSSSTLLNVAVWTTCFGLGSDEVVLTLNVEEITTIEFWDFFSTSRTENDFPSSKSN